MKTRLSLAVIVMAAAGWVTPVRAGDLNVAGNLAVASNLTAATVTLGGEPRTNWPGSSGGAVDLASPVLDFAQSAALYRYVLTNNTAWVFTNHVAGRQVYLQIAQDATGDWQMTWPTNEVLWPSWQVVSPSSGPDSLSVFKILDNGTYWLAQAEGRNFNPGPPDYALEFDGSQSYVTAGHNDAFYPNPLTVEAWVRTTKDWYSNFIALYMDASGNGWGLSLNPGGGTLSFGLATTSGFGVLSGTTNVNNGLWHHVAVVWDGSQLRGYVDGQLDCTANIGGSQVYPSSNTACVLGYSPWTSAQFWEGDMDEVRISSAVLYTNNFTRHKSYATNNNTVVYWKMNEGTGTTLTDSSGNGHNGTLSGTPTPVWVGGVTADDGMQMMSMQGGGGQSYSAGRVGGLSLQQFDLSSPTFNETNTSSPPDRLLWTPFGGQN